MQIRRYTTSERATKTISVDQKIGRSVRSAMNDARSFVKRSAIGIAARNPTSLVADTLKPVMQPEIAPISTITSVIISRIPNERVPIENVQSIAR